MAFEPTNDTLIMEIFGLEEMDEFLTLEVFNVSAQLIYFELLINKTLIEESKEGLHTYSVVLSNSEKKKAYTFEIQITFIRN